MGCAPGFEILKGTVLVKTGSLALHYQEIAVTALHGRGMLGAEMGLEAHTPLLVGGKTDDYHIIRIGGYHLSLVADTVLGI